MKYCPSCGGFAQDNQSEFEQHSVDCNLTVKGRKKKNGWTQDPKWVSEKPKMLPVNTANRFCGFCNKIFDSKVENCHRCNRPTSQITEDHLQPGVSFLSGSGAAKIWEPAV
jgi:hypothetical protein